MFAAYNLQISRDFLRQNQNAKLTMWQQSEKLYTEYVNIL